MSTIKNIIIPSLIIFIILFLLLYYLLIYYSKNLPSINEIIDYDPKTISKIFSREKEFMGIFFDEKREYRSIDKIPKLIKNAFISAEDKNFFKHSGYDILGYIKAIFGYFKDGKLRGASTITQQITKSFLLSGERSFERKIKELILTIRLEKSLTKEKILEIYLNDVYLGENSYGVTAASKTYFSKDLEELTPGEASFLAALPKSPVLYSPRNNILNATLRRNFVLKEMLQNKYLDKKTAKKEIEKDLITNFNKKSLTENSYNLLEGYLAEEIKGDIIKILGDRVFLKGGLNIQTSIDKDLQKKSQELLISKLISLDLKNNKVKPPVFKTNTDFLENLDWNTFFKVQNNVSNKVFWDLGVIVKKEFQKIFVRTENINIPKELNFDHLDDLNFSIGDVIYLKKEDNNDKFRYQQIPFFNGGLLIFDRDTLEKLVSIGGFNYYLNDKNMLTEKRTNFKEALKPFFLSLMVDNNIYSNSDNIISSMLLNYKKTFNDFYLNEINKEFSEFKFNNNHLNKESFDIATKYIDERNRFINKNSIEFSTEITFNDLMGYYNLLISGKIQNNNKYVKKIENEFGVLYQSNVTKNVNNFALKKLSYNFSKLLNNKEFINFINLKKYFIKNNVLLGNKDEIYGWHIFDNDNYFDLFIGFNSKKIIGCYLNSENPNKKVNINILKNACVDLVKEIIDTDKF